MRRLPTILLSITCLAPPALEAQVPPEPGARVRVVTVQGDTVVGSVVEAAADRLRLDVDSSGAVEVRRDRVDALERSLGKGYSGRHFLGVTTAFALFGGVFGAINYPPATDTPCGLGCIEIIPFDWNPSSRTDAFFTGMGVGALIGLPIALLVGAEAGSERWEPIEGFEAAGDMRVRPLLGPRPGLAFSVPTGG